MKSTLTLIAMAAATAQASVVDDIVAAANAHATRRELAGRMTAGSPATAAEDNTDPFSARRLANTNATGPAPSAPKKTCPDGYPGSPPKTCPDGFNHGCIWKGYPSGIGKYNQGIEAANPDYFIAGDKPGVFDKDCCAHCGPEVSSVGLGNGATTCEHLVKRVSKGGCFSDCFSAMTTKAQSDMLEFSMCDSQCSTQLQCPVEQCCTKKEIEAGKITIKQSFAPSPSPNTAAAATVGLASIAILAVVAALGF